MDSSTMDAAHQPEDLRWILIITITNASAAAAFLCLSGSVSVRDRARCLSTA